MNHYVSLSLANRKSSVHLHALYSPRTALRTFLPRRDHLAICGQYPVYDYRFGYHGYQGNPLPPTQLGPHWSHSQNDRSNSVERVRIVTLYVHFVTCL
jgi:hypothetical protein